MKRPAVFFDRDGVVNLSPGPGYVLSWEDFHFSPGIKEALHLCKTRGYALVLATSQQGVGKGLMSQAELDGIHARMQAELAAHDAAFDGIYACTCLSKDPGCTCRMGPASDRDAVVDSELRVHGVEGLRVADASIMPEIVNAPIHAACVMIGEKCASIMSDR